MRLTAGMCIIWVIGFGAFAAKINLSGTVKDGQGTAIADAVATPVSDLSIKDTTNANGEFAILNASPIYRVFVRKIRAFVRCRSIRK